MGTRFSNLVRPRTALRGYGTSTRIMVIQCWYRDGTGKTIGSLLSGMVTSGSGQCQTAKIGTNCYCGVAFISRRGFLCWAGAVWSSTQV